MRELGYKSLILRVRNISFNKMAAFQDKVVWITGASSGIGEALAYAFAQQGAKLVLSARRKEVLAQVAKQTNLPNCRVLILPIDMTQTDQMPYWVEMVLSHFGQLDILIHNAGISQRASIIDCTMPVYRTLMEVNFLGVVALTKAVLPHFLSRKTGQFIAISSIAGKIGTPWRSGYCASKHALVGFCDALRAEVTPQGIGVLVVYPGYIKTNISLNALDAQGNKYAKMDTNQAKGLAASICATRIVKATQQAKKEVYIAGWYEMAGIYLKRFLPNVLFKLTATMQQP